MAIKTLRITGIERQTLGLALVLTLAPAGAGLAAEPPAPPVKVGVYAKHSGNKILYFYRVTNKSQQDITAVSVGYNTMNDEDPVNDVWELTELPSGWNPKLGIPATSSNSPTGWRVSMTTPGNIPSPGSMSSLGNTPFPGEESKAHAITWEVVNNKSPVLAGGQTMAKMSITLDKADINYLNGHALVTFADDSPAVTSKGSSTAAIKNPPTITRSSPAPVPTDFPAAVTKIPPLNISVPLEPLDTSPPAISVTLTPNTIWSPEDNKYLPVNVTFSKKEDDFDNLPEIKLESITANEPLEPGDIRDASYGLDDRYLRLRSKRNGNTDRIYTVTYSATDASGNQTTASASVTVPAIAPETTPVTAPVPATAPVAAPAPATTPAAVQAPVPTPVTAPRSQVEKKKIEVKNR